MPRPTDPRLEEVSSAAICDALEERLGHAAHVRDLITPTPGRELYGPAATMRLVPQREDAFDEELHSFRRVFYEAVTEPREGHVLVLDTSGHLDHALVGAAEAARLDEHRMAGMLADCRLRDSDEIAGMDLSTWCRGYSPKADGEEMMAVGANVPAVLGNATIVPGDWIYADTGGTVIVPEAHLDEVLDRAVEIAEENEAAVQAVREEDPDEILSQPAPS